MNPGTVVKASKKNANRITAGTVGVVIRAKAGGKVLGHVWVEFKGHDFPKLMKISELEVVNES